MKQRELTFYFIGIGGAGMSGLAEILLNMGHRVQGSDRERSELTDYLQSKGATIFIGHHAENLQKADYLIYSSAIPKDNPEMVRAAEMGIPRIRRAEMLGQLFNRKYGIGIAGTHGKTTTTSMLGSVLMYAKQDPTIIVGGKLQNLMTNARLGNGPFLVAEADEYDRSFLTLFPRIGVLTSLEADHLDIYKDLDDLKQTFVKYANQVAFDGVVIVCTDELNLKEILPKIERPVCTYGVEVPADYMAKEIQFKENGSQCRVWERGEQLGILNLNVPGTHNIKNALSVIAAARELDIPFETIAQGLKEFEGVGRRFETIGVKNDILVVDDYAHHPTEVNATIEGAKKGWQRRVVAVFQPHLFSRTQDFYRDFASVLSKADVTVVMDVYPARELPVAGVDGRLITDLLTNQHFYVKEKEMLTTQLLKIVRSGDLVLFMGAGDIWKYSRELLNGLEGK